MGRRWRFCVQHGAGLWSISNLEMLDDADLPSHGGDTGPFWQLNPVTRAFTVYDDGDWRLKVTYGLPNEYIETRFSIQYRHEDDDSLVDTLETSSPVEARRYRVTSDSDWSEHALAQLGSEIGRHGQWR